MAARNPTRRGLHERFEALVEQYNAGSLTAADFFNQLLALVGDMNVEDRRAVREGLTEEELAIFDILTQPGADARAGRRGPRQAGGKVVAREAQVREAGAGLAAKGTRQSCCQGNHTATLRRWSASSLWTRRVRREGRADVSMGV